jgi:nicotinamidase-related amidase
MRTDLERDWSQFALLLIDAQKDFWSEKMAQHFPDFPTKVARLMAFCQAEGLEIVHLRAEFQPDMSDWMVRYKLQGRIPCVQGTVGVEVLPFARHEPGETVIVKRTFDGFHNPKLLTYLRQKGKRFVLTAGLVTSVCLLFTTVSAAQSGLLTAIIEDCCADHPQRHEQTLETYQFIFRRTKVDLLPEQYPEWLADLKKLEKF